ncbi:MAG: ribosomal RNA small subunit methyltransferase A [Treponema sp.]|nr:ribosomal RNA small subunit methyltransferase A [Treponema sp.]
MNHFDYNSPVNIKSFLEENSMAMQKKFGQNFLINEAARKRIASCLPLEKGSLVWEVGPGLGCMTELFLEAGACVRVFEIDKGFIKSLKKIFAQEIENGSLVISEGDVLKNWKKEYALLSEDQKKNIFLAGNLPYNIAATFIASTIEENIAFKKCVFTVQKEVAERMCAKPSDKNYSAFSVLCSRLYDVKTEFEIGPANFWPRPNVSSKTSVLQKIENPPECEPKLFVKLVHALFSSRRKTILNNIKGLLPPDTDAKAFLTEAGTEPSLRAENLSAEDFASLSMALSKIIKNAG